MFSSLTLLLVESASTWQHQRHILHQHDFSTQFWIPNCQCWALSEQKRSSGRLTALTFPRANSVVDTRIWYLLRLMDSMSFRNLFKYFLSSHWNPHSRGRVRTRGGDCILLTEVKQRRNFLFLINTKRYFVMTSVINLGDRIPCGMCFTGNTIFSHDRN